MGIGTSSSSGGGARAPQRIAYAVHRDAHLSWGGLPAPGRGLSSVRPDACHLYGAVTHSVISGDVRPGSRTGQPIGRDQLFSAGNTPIGLTLLARPSPVEYKTHKIPPNL